MLNCLSNFINTPKPCNDFIISIISSITSFKINKVNPVPALTAPFQLIFLSNLFIAFEVKLLTNPGKWYIAKEITISVSAFVPKLPNQEPIDPTD